MKSDSAETPVEALPLPGAVMSAVVFELGDRNLARTVAGVLQNLIDDVESENYVTLVSKTLDIPAIVRADGACSVLSEEQLVTLDPKKALVYNGVQLEQNGE